MRTYIATGLLIAIAADVQGRAQCPFQTAITSPYGSSCPLSISPHWFVQFRPSPCELDITLQMSQLLLSTLQGGWIALGFSPQQTVYPGLGLCARMSNPVAVMNVGTSGLLTLNIPPGLQPLTFYVDGAALYQNTAAPGYTWLSPYWGLQITLQ